MHVGQDRTDDPDDGRLIGEDAHDPGPAFDLLVDPLQGVDAPDLADGRSLTQRAGHPQSPPLGGTLTWHQYLGTSDSRASGTMTARTAAYADD